MKIELMFHSHHESLADFKRKTIRSGWDSLILVADGEYSILVGDSKEKIVVRKNEIAFIPAHIEFYRYIDFPVTYYNICFTEQGNHPFYAAASRGILKLPYSSAESIIESMRLASLLPESRDLVIHITEHIFAENYLFGGNDSFKTLSEEVENAIRYMRNNLDKRIDMEELANRVFLSHNGLIWKFKQELNTTPSKYLYLLRMRNAKHLLLGHSYSITEVSEMCGYQNPYYFSNEFRRYYKMSPSKFRKHYLKGDK